VQITPDLDALLRMGLAVLCGMAVGYNRAQHFSEPQPNRVRVHVLVGLSACLMVLAAGADLSARSRAIQGVATGIGFLGAGEILVDRSGAGQRGAVSGPITPQVHGLTSAASIWFTAALGVTVAASTPMLAAVALLLALIVLSQHNGNRHGTVHGGGDHGGGERGADDQGGDDQGGDDRG
jgi:putative Mg2+ transporter-C (MgtC) family protein